MDHKKLEHHSTGRVVCLSNQTLQQWREKYMQLVLVHHLVSVIETASISTVMSKIQNLHWLYSSLPHMQFLLIGLNFFLNVDQMSVVQARVAAFGKKKY